MKASPYKLFLFMSIIFFLSFLGGFWMYPRPMISVVMATYNRGNEYLPKAIDSILSQTMGDFELIIINDASTDNTQEILDNYVKNDKRIRVYSNKQNKGLVYNLNFGLKKARGKYIARMDDDDRSLPERFEKQLEFMKNNPDITAVGCFYRRPNNPKKIDRFPTDSEQAKIHSLFEVPIAHPCAMIKNSFLKKNNILYVDDYALAEDMPFWRDIIWKYNGKITNLPLVLLEKDAHSPKFYGYERKQWESFIQYGKDSMQMLLGSAIPKTSSRCVYYKHMKTLNQKKQFVSPNVLENFIKRSCSSNDIHLLNPIFEEIFTLKDGYLISGSLKAKILHKTDDFLELSWDDNNQSETYKKNANDVFELIVQ